MVGLLRELTLRDHDLVVRITDQDGELLLIETADQLPRLDITSMQIRDGRYYQYK